MEKIIAIPLEQGVLSAHFGHCEQFAIVQIENNLVSDIQILNPPAHEPGVYPQWVSSMGVSDVIAGGIGQKAIQLFNNLNINVFAGAPIKAPGQLVLDFLGDKLNLSANYCNHDSGHKHACRH